jgi:hypothetical protein
MINKGIAFLSLVLILCVPVLAYSGGNPAGQPFESLQKQIDTLTRQLGDIADRFTPPAISYTLSCLNPFEVNIELNVIDDKEIAYYAIQKQGGDPPFNIITFVEPGLTSANYSLLLGVGDDDQKYLLIASDTYGNVSKYLLQINRDICVTPCPPGQICPQ